MRRVQIFNVISITLLLLFLAADATANPIKRSQIRLMLGDEITSADAERTGDTRLMIAATVDSTSMPIVTGKGVDGPIGHYAQVKHWDNPLRKVTKETQSGYD